MMSTKSVRFGMALTLVVFVTALTADAQTNQKQQAALPDAPPLKLEKLLQAPPDASADWAKLKGKLVVVEFWATWCSPCVAAIPHLNEIAKELADQPVVFISVTDDEETQLNEFLKTSPLKSWIGVDSTRANWPVFDIHSIPTTVIVNPEGKLLATTRPEEVTTGKLRDLLRGQAVAFAAPETRDSNLAWDQDEIEWKDGVGPLTSVIIKPIKTATSGSLYKPGGNYLTADGEPLQVLVHMAYQADIYHMDWRVPKPVTSQAYRVVARVPKGRESQLLPLFQNALAATFGVKASWHMEEKEVYVLRVIDGQVVKLSVADKDEERDFRVLRGRGSSRRYGVDKLTEFLSQFVLDSIVIDETKLTGEYNWNLPYQHGKPEATLAQLKDLGLEVVKARRPVNILVVEPE
ncbi:MAG TPA: TIGR03435 family protein [Pyrinomonadaceae bacterium]|nr:TIGR03435 family protein [Pyrinomonadaceae bacterium]